MELVSLCIAAPIGCACFYVFATAFLNVMTAALLGASAMFGEGPVRIHTEAF